MRFNLKKKWMLFYQEVVQAGKPDRTFDNVNVIESHEISAMEEFRSSKIVKYSARRVILH